ncbi:MAG: LysR family transcriptional regulator [Minicystis sp.]
MQSSAFSWDDLRVLLAVQRGGSFLAAGRALGVATSTVARRVSALEAHLGVRLVQRGAEGAIFEAASAPLLALAEQLERQLSLASRDVSADEARFAGKVRISAGEGFVPAAARVAAAFRAEHPETHVEIVADARLHDLARREADIGIRTARSRSDPLLVRRVGELRYGLYASAGYWAAHRAPRGRGLDFARHDFVGYEGFLAQQPEMLWLAARGARRFPFLASNTEGLLAGALAGQGVAALPHLLAAEHPSLTRVRLDEDPPAKPVFVAMHRDLKKVGRVRALAEALGDALAEGLAEAPPRQRSAARASKASTT